MLGLRWQRSKAPSISVVGGVASIQGAGTGDSIYYTTDGTRPRPSEGLRYAGSFAVSSPTTIQTLAQSRGRRPSTVITTTYSTGGGGGTWAPLRIGAGGFLPSIEVLADPNHPADPAYRAICARCDTYGGYIGNGIDPWHQVLSSSTIPAQYLATYWLGTQAAPAQDDPPFSEGVFDIRLAKTNPDIGFAIFGYGDYGQGGHVWRTTNRGGQWWMVSSFGVGSFTANYGGWDWRGVGQYRFGIDPANPTTLGAGTGTVYAGVLTGLWYSRNAYDPTPGNVTWTNLSPGQIATPNAAGVTGVVFDPGAAPPTNGRTSWVYACSNGTGVYRSTDGGTTWTLLSGGPTQVIAAYVDSAGTYWAISSSAMNMLYKRDRGASSWTTIAQNGPQGLQGNNFQGLAIHPTVAGRVVIVHDGRIEFTFNGGASWNRYGPYSMARDTTGDIPWLGTTPHGQFMVGSAFWDPVDTTKIWISDGIGLWWTTAPTSAADITTVTWHSKSLGIEQMVSTCIVVPWTSTPPASDNVYVSVWDRNVFRVPRSNTGYTADHASHVAGSTVEISSSYGVDYSRENPNHLAYISNYPLDQAGGYTLDGGDHWTLFPTQPGGAGGDIAVPSIDSIIVLLGQDGGSRRSTDRGSTWVDLANYGLPGNNISSVYWDADGTRRLAIDGGYNGTTNQIVYCYVRAVGLYRSTDKGANWSQIDTRTFTSDSYAIQLKSVPGQSGILFMSTGFIGAPQGRHPWSNSAMYYTRGAADTPDTISWAAVTGFGSDWPEGDGEVFTYAFGAPNPATPGQTFPTIYVMGYHGFEFGIWRSTDFNPVNNTATWQKVDNFARPFYDGSGQLGAGSLDGPIAMGASMSVYGEIYVGYTGSSFAKRSGD